MQQKLPQNSRSQKACKSETVNQFIPELNPASRWHKEYDYLLLTLPGGDTCKRGKVKRAAGLEVSISVMGPRPRLLGL